MTIANNYVSNPVILSPLLQNKPLTGNPFISATQTTFQMEFTTTLLCIQETLTQSTLKTTKFRFQD